MATKFLMRDIASDVSQGSETEKQALTTQGAAAVTKITNTAAGPTAGVVMTDGAGGANITFYSNPLRGGQSLSASNSITFNIRGLESAAQANTGPQVTVELVDQLGNFISTVGDKEEAIEFGTSETAHNFTVTATATTINHGNRLKFSIKGNDAGGTMNSGRTFSIVYNGATGATGDTFVSFVETLTFGALGWGQAQADIKTQSTGFGQTNADIKNTATAEGSNPYGQAQADIKAIGTGFGQTQAKILVPPQTGQAQGRLISTYEKLVKALGPASYWKLDESTGQTTIKDYVGSVDGSVQGTLTFSQPGANNLQTGTAIGFDANSANYIDFGDNYDQISQAFSVVLWVYPNVNKTHYLVSKANSGLTSGWSINVSGNIQFKVNSTSVFSVASSINLTSWNFVVVTFNGTTSYSTIANNISSQSSSASNPLTDITNTLKFGVQESGANNLDGLLDEVVIFNKVLSVDDAFALYTVGLSGAIERAGQAQAFIFHPSGIGQANAIIGTYSNILDTASRIIAPGTSLGTADLGGAWTTIVGASTSVNNDKISLIDGATSTTYALNQTLNPSNVEIYFEASIYNKVDITTTTLIISANVDSSRNLISGYELDFSLNSAGLLNVGVFSRGVGHSTGQPLQNISPGDTFAVKAQIIRVSNNRTHTRLRVWNINSTEPETWFEADASNSVNQIIPGHVELRTIGATLGINYFIDNLSIKEAFLTSSGMAQAFIGIPTRYAQAQAKIIGKLGYGQVNADIKTQNFGSAQSNGYIRGQSPTTDQRRSFGQAVGLIRSGFKYSQSQAKIFNPPHAQAQAYIRLQAGWGQSIGLISGTYNLPISDNFDRTVAVNSGLGVSSNGDTYTTLFGTTTGIGVDGDYATYLNLVPASLQALNRSLINPVNGLEVVATIKITTLPSSSIELNIGVVFYGVSYQIAGAHISIDSSGVVSYGGQVEGGLSQSSSLSTGTDYTLKAQIIKATEASKNFITRAKFWQTSSTEPGWSAVGETTPTGSFYTILHGFAGISTADNGGTGAWAIKDFTISEAHFTTYGQAQAKITASAFIGGSGQAQADIKQTNSSFAQSQADIKATNNGFGQSQSDVKATNNGFAQAQADLKATGNGFGQSQGDIKAIGNGLGQSNADILATGFGLGQSNADIKATNFGLGQAQADIKQTYPLGFIYSIKVTSDGATSYWRMNESNGNPQDSIGGNHVVSTTGSPIYGVSSGVTQDPGTAIDLNSNTEFTVTDHANLDLGNIFSIEFWIKLNVTAFAYILEKAGGAYAIYLDSNNTIYFYKPGIGDLAHSSVTLSNSTYHYVVITKNGSDRKVYIDGVDQTVLDNDFTLTDSANDLKIGNAGGNFLNGALDEIAFYNGIVLSAGQVATHYTIGTKSGNSAQAQADIKATNSGFGQANTDIKALGNGLAQAQADVKTSYFGLGQSQADIKAIGQGFGQSQADIDVISAGYGQAQADIKAVNSGFGQSQADIKAVGNGFAQANSDIRATNNGLGQAQATIQGNVFGQAQGDIKQIYSQFAQSQADIKSTSAVFAQTQVDIKAINSGFGQTQADIKAIGYGESQSQADILTEGYGSAQANADILAQGYGEGQAQAKILIPTSYGSGQAQSDIKQTYTQSAQAQADILAAGYGIGQSQGDIKAVGYGEGQSNADIKQINSAFGQTQADILQIYQQYAQSQSDIKQTYNSFAQSQADILATSYGLGQSQADIKQVGYGEAQANADIKATNNGVAQAQGDILAVGYGLAQSQADIKQTYTQSAQTQADILNTYFGLGQSQSDIKSAGYGEGQATADILSTNSTFGQSQADIRQTYFGLGQSQADILNTYNGVGQSQADIKAVGNGFGQCQAYIYIPQNGRPNSDISVTGWVRVVI